QHFQSDRHRGEHGRVRERQPEYLVAYQAREVGGSRPGEVARPKLAKGDLVYREVAGVGDRIDEDHGQTHERREVHESGERARPQLRRPRSRQSSVALPADGADAHGLVTGGPGTAKKAPGSRRSPRRAASLSRAWPSPPRRP